MEEHNFCVGYKALFLDEAVFIGYIEPSPSGECEASGGISVFNFQFLIKIPIQSLLYGENKTNKRKENVM